MREPEARPDIVAPHFNRGWWRRGENWDP